MSEAPKEIWAYVAGMNSEGPFGIWDLRKARADNPDFTLYIRADIAQAELDEAVQAAYEACLKIVEDGMKWGEAADQATADVTCEYLAAAIRERGK